MNRLTANFYPAAEPKHYPEKHFLDEDGNQRSLPAGTYVGKANIMIGNAFRINEISVFLNDDDGKLNLKFKTFPMNDRNVSFVRPISDEARDAMCSVVDAARNSESGFAFISGTYNPQFQVIKKELVDEPVADGRFSVQIGDICTVRGICTRPAEYEVNGEKRSFVAVDMPNVIGQDGRPTTYEKDGHTRYNKVFEPRVSTWIDQEGNQRSKNYGKTLAKLIRDERRQLLEASKEHPALSQQMDRAKERSKPSNARQAAPRDYEMSM